jgi:hypothetical protein
MMGLFDAGGFVDQPIRLSQAHAEFVALQMRFTRHSCGLPDEPSSIDREAVALDATAPETFERWIAADTDLTFEEWSAPAHIRCLKCSGPAEAQSNYCAGHSTGARR